jgi:hypothetical protein
MTSRWTWAALLLALTPAAASAFETVDAIPYPSLGGFTEAYPRGERYPTELWAQAGMMYDTNPFRLADGTNTRSALGKDHKWDAVMRYGLGGSIRQRVFSRQSVRLSARGDYYDYQRYSVLDHFAYGLLGEWLWEFGENLTGTAGYERTNRLADPAEVQRPFKDEVTANRLYATAAYRVTPDWRLTGGVERARAERSGDRAEVNTDVNTVRAGVDYLTPLGNAIGLEARRSEGSAPVSEFIDPTGQFANNDFTEHEVALTAAYNLGAQLLVGGRIGRTKRSYSELPVEEFNGTTYDARVDWRPSAKIGFLFEVYRRPSSVIEIDATHVDLRGVAFGPRWAPTAKLVFYARLSSEQREYQALDAGLTVRDETARTIRLGAGWEPERHIKIGAGIDYGERNSNIGGRDYDYLALILNARYDF